jgi:hypothetical protein
LVCGAEGAGPRCALRLGWSSRSSYHRLNPETRWLLLGCRLRICEAPFRRLYPARPARRIRPTQLSRSSPPARGFAVRNGTGE